MRRTGTPRSRTWQGLAQLRVIRQLTVGASLMDRVPRGAAPTPQPAGGTQTRTGLALLRDLGAGGLLVHDETDELDEALGAGAGAGGSGRVAAWCRGPTHLVRAVVWAVAAAHKPAPVPAIR